MSFEGLQVERGTIQPFIVGCALSLQYRENIQVLFMNYRVFLSFLLLLMATFPAMFITSQVREKGGA